MTIPNPCFVFPEQRFFDIIFLSVDGAFPSQFGMLEVEQQCELESSDVQVAQHLGCVRIAEL